MAELSYSRCFAVAGSRIFSMLFDSCTLRGCRIGLLVCALAMFASAFPVALIAEDEELIKDGGLEAAPEGWKLWGAGRMEVLKGEGESRSGRQAVRIEPAAEGGEPHVRVHPADRIPARPDVEYRFSAWVRGKGKAAPFAWAYSPTGGFIGGAKLNEGEGHEIELGTEWRQISMTFSFEDEDVGGMIPGLALHGKDTWLVADDLSLTVDRAKYPASESSLDDGWILGNPAELFIPQGGMVYMRFALRSPEAGELKDFGVAFTVPDRLRLLRYDSPGGWAKDLPASSVKSEDVMEGGRRFRRYVLGYPPEKVAPFGARIGAGWLLQPPHSGSAAIAAAFFQMDGEIHEDGLTVTACRIANGRPEGNPVEMALRVVPAFSGKSPGKIEVYYYGFPAPYEVQKLFGSPYPEEVAEAAWKQFQGLGNTRYEIGTWGLEEKPVFREFVWKLKRGIRRGGGDGNFLGRIWGRLFPPASGPAPQIGFARLSGMNYVLGYLADPPDKQKPSSNPGCGALEIVAAHPEVQWRQYSGSKESVPAVWQPSVFFRWFDQKLLFDPETRARKPAVWCQQYLADGGRLYRDYWLEKFKELKGKIPVDFIHWDWEYANVGFSCFCERDLAAFRKFAEIPSGEELTDLLVAGKYPSEWMKFRAWQNARIVGEFHGILKEAGLKFEAYSPGVTPEYAEGLDWSQCVGKFDTGFVGSPGANPGKWFASNVKAGDDLENMFNMKMISQLIVEPPASPAVSLYPRRRFNDMLRCVAAYRGGINPWVNIGQLDNINGAECFERAALDVVVKYEDWFWEGKRATGEFKVSGLRSAEEDLAAFRLPGRPLLLLVFNDGRKPKKVAISCLSASKGAKWTDGLTGKPLGSGTSVSFEIDGHNTKVIEIEGADEAR